MSNALPTIQEQDEPIGPGSEVFPQSAAPSQTAPAPKLPLSGSGILPIDRSLRTLTKTKDITLTGDCFGVYRVENSPPIKVKRFTWKSSDKVEVQIITYGARIIAMKCPDKYGKVADIVLGFSDLSGYLFYGGEHLFGATIGCTTNKIKNASFELDGKNVKLSQNFSNCHSNGGFCGLDKVVWNSYMNNTQVILTYVIPDKQEGLPGPIMISISYELTIDRGFRIEMSAKSAKPTILDLSNLCYFNLGGHHGGPKELAEHSVSINANCYTVMDENEFPSGEIMNVVYSKFDFSAPRLMKNYLGVEPGDGYDQNLCVNRPIGQGNCFVARAVHSKNGRVLEIYSNQYGVRFNTANDFGLGVIAPPPSSVALHAGSLASQEGGVFVLINQVYEMMNSIQEYNENNFEQVRNLIMKIRRSAPVYPKEYTDKSISFVNPDFCFSSLIDTLWQSMVEVESIIPRNIEDVKTWSELKIIVQDVLEKYRQMDQVEAWTLTSDEEQDTKDDSSEDRLTPTGNTTVMVEGDDFLDLGKSNHGLGNKSGSHQSVLKKISSTHSGSRTESSQASYPKGSTQIASEKQLSIGESSRRSASSTSTTDKTSSRIDTPRVLYDYPNFYNDGRIHGKNNAIYKRHGAMAFQTQNYPDAIHHKNFPSPILRPGQTYKHTIVYKFWVQGNGLKALKTKTKCR